MYHSRTQMYNLFNEFGFILFPKIFIIVYKTFVDAIFFGALLLSVCIMSYIFLV
jgi:hypothetical protein